MFSLNRSPLLGRGLDERDVRLLGPDGAAEVRSLLAFCPVYRPTPLVELPALAHELGISGLFIKDESARLNLSSFKALGGAYAVIRLVLDEARATYGQALDPWSLLDPAVRRIASALTVTCATDGNHGRAVAAGARLVGAQAVIFVPRQVSPARVEAMRGLGAHIEHIDGGYDDAVAAAQRASLKRGWHLLADTSSRFGEEAALRIMQGYTVTSAEALEQLRKPPTHIFLQAGVGGFAAAVAAHVVAQSPVSPPRMITVEPERAACVMQSHDAGRPVRITESEPTVMAMLDCHEPSVPAWHILMHTIDAFMTVTDAEAIGAMRRLARPSDNDPPLVSGESGAAGFAGLTAAVADPELRSAVGLDESARVLLFSTEGATDPEIYARLVRN